MPFDSPDVVLDRALGVFAAMNAGGLEGVEQSLAALATSGVTSGVALNPEHLSQLRCLRSAALYAGLLWRSSLPEADAIGYSANGAAGPVEASRTLQLSITG